MMLMSYLFSIYRLYDKAVVSNIDSIGCYVITINLNNMDIGIFPVDEWCHHVDVAFDTNRPYHCQRRSTLQ